MSKVAFPLLLLSLGSCVVAWCAEDEEDGQRMSIFQAETNDWSSDNHLDDEETTLIWETGSDCLVRGTCVRWGTTFIKRHIQDAAKLVDDTSLGPDDGSLNIVLFETGEFLASRDYESETIRLRGSWRRVREGGPIWHEIGHAFFDKYMSE